MKAGKKRILIVDDEPGITRMLKLNLEREYEMRAENNALSALATARDFLPDLILLDVVMPGMLGGELADRLHAMPDLKTVPIVFLTAAATKDEVRAHHGLIGGLPFLAKPVDVQEVRVCLSRHLAA